MKALKLLAAASAAAVALFAFNPMAEAQGPPGGFRGAPNSRGSPGRGAASPRSNAHASGHRHGGWWGSGHWRGGWWGPGVWGHTWWGPGVWGPTWWGPGAWGTAWWGPGVWVPGNIPPVWIAPAPTYIERSSPVEPAAPVWWYWCADARTYYPYVKECPGGWQRVAPQTVQPAGSQ